MHFVHDSHINTVIRYAFPPYAPSYAQSSTVNRPTTETVEFTVNKSIATEVTYYRRHGREFGYLSLTFRRSQVRFTCFRLLWLRNFTPFHILHYSSVTLCYHSSALHNTYNSKMSLNDSKQKYLRSRIRMLTLETPTPTSGRDPEPNFFHFHLHKLFPKIPRIPSAVFLSSRTFTRRFPKQNSVRIPCLPTLNVHFIVTSMTRVTIPRGLYNSWNSHYVIFRTVIYVLHFWFKHSPGRNTNFRLLSKNRNQFYRKISYAVFLGPY
jgi:hypothetical protein